MASPEPDRTGEHLALARGAVDAAPVDDWATVFAALGDPNRLRILLAVHHAPGINVGALATATGLGSLRPGSWQKSSAQRQ